MNVKAANDEYGGKRKKNEKSCKNLKIGIDK